MRLAYRLPAIFAVWQLLGAAPAMATAFDDWATLASAKVTSPVTASSRDEHVAWVAPDGRTVSLTVRTPHAAATAASVTLPAVPAGADARPYFDAALQQVVTSKAATLIIPKGTYTFQSLNKTSLGHLLIQGLKDVTIDGQGSILVFSQNADGIYVTQSSDLEIKNLTVQYSLKMYAIGTMQQQNGQNVLVVDPAYPVTASDGIGHLAQYDPTSNAFVLSGPTFYSPPGSSTVPVFAGNQTYTSPGFQQSTYNGKTFMVFHHWYGGNAIQIEDSPSAGQTHDITLNNVTVNSGPGMGIVAYGLKRGLAIVNSAVAAAPGSLLSTEYDAMHMLIAGGDVALIGNTIADQGDDAINLNNPIFPIISTSSGGKDLVLGIYSRFISQHDTLAFFDSANNFLGTAAVSQVPTSLGGPSNQYHGVVLNHAITGVSTTTFVRDLSLIDSRVAVENNVIGNCQCHGILVQTPNTLVANNSFTHTYANAVRLLTNIGNFVEGVGAINVIVASNTIANTGMDAGISGMPWSAISLYGVNASFAVSSIPVNKNVQISNNVITNAAQGCITAASSEAVTMTGNTCSSADAALPNGAGVAMLNANTISFQQNARNGTTGPLSINSASTFNVEAQSNF